MQRNAVYAAMIESLDENIGRLMQKLDDLKIAVIEHDRFVYSLDNGGYHQMQHRPSCLLRGAKSEPYEGGVRVPFIVRWPGVVKAFEQRL